MKPLGVFHLVTVATFAVSTAFVPSCDPFRVHKSSTSTSTCQQHAWLSAAVSTSWAPSPPANSTGFSFQDLDYGVNTLPLERRRKRTSQESVAKTRKHQFQIYCDLDGVLVDFESGVRSIFPERTFSDISSFQIPDLERNMLWQRVQQVDGFFARLPWTTGGKRLWDAIRPHQPTILTGVPQHKSSRKQKFLWCKRELGIPVNHIDKAGQWRSHIRVSGTKKKEGVVNVITCWSDNKHYECRGPNSVLIDDREFLRKGWERQGGIFVHHDGDVDKTLAKLRALGIIHNEEQDTAAKNPHP